MPEDDLTLSQVHGDLVQRLEHDKRLRAVEQDVAVLKTLPTQIKELRSDLGEDIKSVHAAVQQVHTDMQHRSSNLPVWLGAAIAAVAVVLTLASALYGG